MGYVSSLGGKRKHGGVSGVFETLLQDPFEKVASRLEKLKIQPVELKHKFEFGEIPVIAWVIAGGATLGFVYLLLRKR